MEELKVKLKYGDYYIRQKKDGNNLSFKFSNLNASVCARLCVFSVLAYIH